jgi:hypothetical protein
VNASFNGVDIGAEGFGDLALGIPASDVPTISEERTVERPCHLIENGSVQKDSREARPCQVASTSTLSTALSPFCPLK